MYESEDPTVTRERRNFVGYPAEKTEIAFRKVGAREQQL